MTAPAGEHGRPPLRGADAAIARVLHGGDNQHVGMAIVLDRVVCSRAHNVVNQALDLEDESRRLPRGPVAPRVSVAGSVGAAPRLRR
jgi:hypothetical protein